MRVRLNRLASTGCQGVDGRVKVRRALAKKALLTGELQEAESPNGGIATQRVAEGYVIGLYSPFVKRPPTAPKLYAQTRAVFGFHLRLHARARTPPPKLTCRRRFGEVIPRAGNFMDMLQQISTCTSIVEEAPLLQKAPLIGAAPTGSQQDATATCKSATARPCVGS